MTGDRHTRPTRLVRSFAATRSVRRPSPTSGVRARAATSHTSTTQHPAVVVGGGPAGLAVAAQLRRGGVPAVVLEQSPSRGATWRGAYDRLRLNTSRLTSRLCGEPYGPGVGHFPSRDVFVSYLERFAECEAVTCSRARGCIGWSAMRMRGA